MMSRIRHYEGATKYVKQSKRSVRITPLYMMDNDTTRTQLYGDNGTGSSFKTIRKKFDDKLQTGELKFSDVPECKTGYGGF